MYADDLILMSISLMHMQALVDICKTEFDKIGMEINTAKSNCLRIGPRHNVSCETININNAPIKWSQEVTYLGIHLASARQLTLNLQQSKQKIFRAVNGIFGMHHLAKWNECGFDSLLTKYGLALNSKSCCFKSNVYKFFQSSLQI